MDKIQILATCKACSGVTYLTSTNESGYSVCQPCVACQGSGRQVEWIDLREFARLLNAIAAENKLPVWQKHIKTRQFASQVKEYQNGNT